MVRKELKKLMLNKYKVKEDDIEIGFNDLKVMILM